MIAKHQFHVFKTDYEPYYDLRGYIAHPNERHYIGTVNVAFALPAEMAAQIELHRSRIEVRGEAEAVETVSGAAEAQP